MESVKRNVLLNPGPATTTDSVKYAQVVPDICPREKEFGDVMEFVSKELTNFVANNDEYTTVLFGGSGTAAVESMLTSAVGDDYVVIINNGAYGRRMCEIAESYGMNYIEFKSSPFEAVDLGALEGVIRDSKFKVSHVAVIHHETTTGLLNDVGSIGALCRKYSLDLIVDGMSSYAGMPMDMKEMNITYLASSSNKCIQGMAGVSFVIAKLDALLKQKDMKRRNYYLNLYLQYDYFKNNYQMRFTPPVQTLYALKQAIIEAKEETIEKRHQRYLRAWEALIAGLDRLGLEHLVKPEDHSKLITTVVEPRKPGYSFNSMHDYIIERGYTIYPGKVGELNTFRIANIGQLDYRDMEGFIGVLEEYLNTL